MHEIMIKQYFYLLMIAFGLSVFSISCGQRTTTDNDHDHTEHADDGHATAPAVSLNDGEKWEANPETTEGIKNMTNLVHGFSKDQDQNAYMGLRSQLEGEFTMILQKCTMTGEAHDQLHNYLLPMKDKFEGLTSEDPAVRQNNLDKLNALLSEYSKYFQ
jgi:hypothetical protein